MSDLLVRVLDLDWIRMRGCVGAGVRCAGEGGDGGGEGRSGPEGSAGGALGRGSMGWCDMLNWWKGGVDIAG